MILVGVVAVAAVLLTIGLSAGWLAGRWMRPPDGTRRIQDSPTLVRQVQALAQFVTVKYVLEKVVIIEDAKWFGESRLIMVAHGVAKAGFDLARLEPRDVRVDGDRLVLRLPKPHLTDVYLDERRTEVVEHSTGVLRQFDQSLEQNARRQALDKIRLAAVEAGILADAVEKAKLQLTLMAQQAGYSGIEIEVK